MLGLSSRFPGLLLGRRFEAQTSTKPGKYDSSVYYYHPPKFSSCGAKSPGFDSGPAHFLIYCCVLHYMRSSGMGGVIQRAHTHASVTNNTNLMNMWLLWFNQSLVFKQNRIKIKLMIVFNPGLGPGIENNQYFGSKFNYFEHF